jgi:glycosyltransferase involved in cell wall biosynthesis
MALRARVRDFRPAVVQGWMYHGNLAALVGHWLAGSRAALAWNIRQTLYDLGREKRLTAAVVRAGALLSRRPTAIVYNSTTSAIQHEQLGYESNRRRLIPNGFDCATFAPSAASRVRMREALGIGEDEVIVGLVSRYHPMKDHMTFVSAIAEVAREYPKARFLMVGRGVRAPAAGIMNAIDRAGLHSQTIVLDERDDVHNIYSSIDIACSSSAWGEGFSNAIGEAMACATPCVVTDVGDSAAIVGETGMVVPPQDAIALASAIGTLVGSGPERRHELGLRARERILEHFSLPTVVSQYETLYESLAQLGGTVQSGSPAIPIAGR